MQEMPLVSVIVPVYNTEEYLGKCLDSILKQTYKNIEVLVINDGSTDNSLEIAKRYAEKDKRIRVVSQGNQGIMPVRIKGIEKSLGQYIGFVDSDDWIESNMYENLVKYMLQYECDIVTSDARIHLLDGTTIIGFDNYKKGFYSDLPTDIYPTMLYDYTQRWRAMRSYLVSKLFRKDFLLQAVNQLDKDIFYDEDTVILCRYCLLCTTAYISREIYYHYSLRENSATQKVRCNEPENMFRVYKNLRQLFDLSPYADIFNRQLKQYMLVLMDRLLSGLCDIHFDELFSWDFSSYQIVFKHKTVIYGAGTYGRGLYKEFMRCCCHENIVAWIDKSPEKAFKWAREHPDEYIGKHLQRVKSISSIKDTEFDYIAVAIHNQTIANEAIYNLEKFWGIPPEKIVWGVSARKNISSVLATAYL